MSRKVCLKIVLVVVLTVVIVQLIPYGRDHTNPPVSEEPVWDSPRTRELAARACFECHSNETRWPWYSHVAPVSWLVQHDVDEARSEMNLSEFDKPQREAHEAAEMVETGEMPLTIYTVLHGSARLSDTERDELARGLRATLDGGAAESH